MSMLDSALSLYEMEKVLEDAIQKSNGKIRTIGDLQLSQEDYKILTLRLRGFTNYQRNVKMYEKYSISLLAIMSNYFHNETSCSMIFKKFQQFFEQVPQYMQRKICENFELIMQEFNLATYGVRITDLNVLIQILLIHSYNTETVFQKYFAALDKCSDGKYTDEFMEEVLNYVYPREMELLDPSIRKRIFKLSLDAYLDCVNNGRTEEEMLEKYIRLPYLFIHTCCKWCEQRDIQGMMKLV